MVNIEFFGLPKDYLATYRDRIRAVTPADVQRVARTYLRPDRYDLVVVTKAAGVAPSLASFGTVTQVDRQSLIR